MAMDADQFFRAAAGALASNPAATMEEIARGVGVSRATLFRRVPSREALVAALCERAAATYIATVEAAQPEESPPADALRRLLKGMAELAPLYGVLVMQALPPDVEQRMLDQTASADERILSLIMRGQETGVFRVDLPARWVLTAMMWLLVGAADGVRLGTLASGDVERLLTETLTGALRRADRR